MNSKYTVIGSNGFIGSHVVKYLSNAGNSVNCIDRNTIEQIEDLGHAIYCIGVTADFRKKPFETVDAHICVLSKILQQAHFESFTYLSSTRIYRHCQSTKEDSELTIIPHELESLYDISKVMGENLCINSGKKNVKIVRLSNVVGVDRSAGNFLSEVILKGIREGAVEFNGSPESSKDYVDINDVCRVLKLVATEGKYLCYNLASGLSLRNIEIATILEKNIGCKIVFKEESIAQIFKEISTERIKSEFGFFAKPLESVVEECVKRYLKEMK